MATLRSVSSAVVSPDGERFAYTVSVPRRPMEDDSGSAWSELHVVDQEGNSTPFITGEVNIGGVAWRPGSSTEITFLAKRDGDDERSLYAISTTGGEARKLFEHSTGISSYEVSADGSQLAFMATDEVDSTVEDLEDKGFNQKVVEEDRPLVSVWVLDLSAEDAEARRLEIEGSARSVRWAGDSVVITATPTPYIDDSYTRVKIRVLESSGATALQIENPGKLGRVSASPSGAHIAFISAADLNDPAAGRLMVAKAADGEFRDLFPSLDAHVSSFAWASDDEIVYIVDVGTETKIGRVNVTNGKDRQLVTPGKAVARALSLAADGRAAVLAETPNHPQELYAMSPSGELRRLTDSNPWLDNLRLARQETVRWKARDGLEIEGVFIYPLDYEEGKRYPLILTVHGGPEAHDRNGWRTGYSTLGQVAAARGFAVLYPNYRGSTGRGVEFSKMGHADAAGPEFDDLIDGIDHLVELGIVDKDRVGITGGSYGGYASAWGTTYYSDRFAAAIPFVGISNNISKVGTTDIPREMYDVHHRKWLWEDFDYFAKSSPVYYVKRNRTPTLILHGEADPRVHPSQSLELFRHLKVLGQAPVRLVLYPGEGHGNRKSAARFDYNVRTLQWFEHYLKGPGGDPPPYEIDYASYLPWVDTDASED